MVEYAVVLAAVVAVLVGATPALADFAATYQNQVISYLNGTDPGSSDSQGGPSDPGAGPGATPTPAPTDPPTPAPTDPPTAAPTAAPTASPAPTATPLYQPGQQIADWQFDSPACAGWTGATYNGTGCEAINSGDGFSSPIIQGGDGVQYQIIADGGGAHGPMNLVLKIINEDGTYNIGTLAQNNGSVNTVITLPNTAQSIQITAQGPGMLQDFQIYYVAGPSPAPTATP